LVLLFVRDLLRKLPERAEEAVAGVEGMDQAGEGIDLWLFFRLSAVGVIEGVLCETVGREGQEPSVFRDEKTEGNDGGPIRENNLWAAIDGTRVSLRWTKEESCGCD